MKLSAGDGMAVGAGVSVAGISVGWFVTEGAGGAVGLVFNKVADAGEFVASTWGMTGVAGMQPASIKIKQTWAKSFRQGANRHIRIRIGVKAMSSAAIGLGCLNYKPASKGLIKP
jgi:hypothetical protein